MPFFTTSPRIHALGLCIAAAMAMAGAGQAEDAEAVKDRAEAHGLRDKAHQLHAQAIKEIEEADHNQVMAEADYRKAAELDHKANLIDKISMEAQRAHTLRMKAHEDERQAHTLLAQARAHQGREERDRKRIEEGEKVLAELKGKNADREEVRLIEDDIQENRNGAAAEGNEVRRLEEAAKHLRQSAVSLLAQADKLDPHGKELDTREHAGQQH